MTLALRRRAVMVKHPEFRKVFERAYKRWGDEQGFTSGDAAPDDDGASLLALLIEEMERG